MGNFAEQKWGISLSLVTKSSATVAFSNYVANAVGNRTDVAPDSMAIVPLTSDLDRRLVPHPAPPGARHDFVLIGRLNAYKNIEVVFEAWRAHVAGAGWRGDELILIGSGDIPDPLPAHSRCVRGTYSYTAVLPTLSHAKGSIIHYRRASQSGVQVLSMQLAVSPIVSREGALPEFQPPGVAPVGVDDVSGLATALDRLADPVLAARWGEAAAQHYMDHHSAEHAARRFMEIFESVIAENRAPIPPRWNPVRHTSG